MDKYINIEGDEVAFTQTGPGTQGQGIGLGSLGTIDPTLMPSGVGPSVISVVSSENIAAGSLVNLYLSGGVLKVQNANATDNTKPYHGFILTGVVSPAAAKVYLPGSVISGLSGLTIGADYYLSLSNGAVTISTSVLGTYSGGNIIQYVGVAISATQIATGINQYKTTL